MTAQNHRGNDRPPPPPPRPAQRRRSRVEAPEPCPAPPPSPRGRGGFLSPPAAYASGRRAGGAQCRALARLRGTHRSAPERTGAHLRASAVPAGAHRCALARRQGSKSFGSGVRELRQRSPACGGLHPGRTRRAALCRATVCRRMQMNTLFRLFSHFACPSQWRQPSSPSHSNFYDSACFCCVVVLEAGCLPLETIQQS